MHRLKHSKTSPCKLSSMEDARGRIKSGRMPGRILDQRRTKTPEAPSPYLKTVAFEGAGRTTSGSSYDDLTCANIGIVVRIIGLERYLGPDAGFL